MHRARLACLQCVLLGALVLLGCRPPSRSTTPEEPAQPARPTAQPLRLTTQRPAEPRRDTTAAVDLCAAPAASFADYAWLPNEVFELVTVRLRDSALATSLATLEGYATGVFGGEPTRALAARFVEALPRLRALLVRAKLQPEEVAFLAAGPTDVWAAPRLCGVDTFARVAAALGLRVREQATPLAVQIAMPASARGYGLVQLDSGGPLWIVAAEQVEALQTWLATLSGDPGRFYAEWLRDPQQSGTLRVLHTDSVPDGVSYTCLTTRRWVVNGSSRDVSMVNTMVQVTRREPAR